MGRRARAHLRRRHLCPVVPQRNVRRGRHCRHILRTRVLAHARIIHRPHPVVILRVLLQSRHDLTRPRDRQILIPRHKRRPAAPTHTDKEIVHINLGSVIKTNLKIQHIVSTLRCHRISHLGPSYSVAIIATRLQVIPCHNPTAGPRSPDSNIACSLVPVADLVLCRAIAGYTHFLHQFAVGRWGGIQRISARVDIRR